MADKPMTIMRSHLLRVSSCASRLNNELTSHTSSDTSCRHDVISASGAVRELPAFSGNSHWVAFWPLLGPVTTGPGAVVTKDDGMMADGGADRCEWRLSVAT